MLCKCFVTSETCALLPLTVPSHSNFHISLCLLLIRDLWRRLNDVYIEATKKRY